MIKTYEKPELDIVLLSTADVICTSSNPADNDTPAIGSDVSSGSFTGDYK